jgi:hypothetical protein
MDVPSTTLMLTLWRALSVKRQANGKGEAAFAAWLANRLPVALIDGAGNIHADLRTQPSHRSAFTSHLDTCHRREGVNKIRNDFKEGKWRADEGECLGADDGAGVALMMHMIDAGVPGLYSFYRGEEVGGAGSSWLADEMPELYDGIDRCISFDRAGYQDVITHQAMGRCCSDDFAAELAGQLSNTGDDTLIFMPDDSGVFTDSANFTHLIPECTNLSVGYRHQHGDGEWLDIGFLQKMAKALVKVQWDSLPTKRDPKVPEPKAWAGIGTYKGYGQLSYSPADFNDQFRGDELPQAGESDGDLMEAIYSAMDRDTRPLQWMLAEWISPTDAASIVKSIDARSLSVGQLEEWVEAMDMYWCTDDEILSEIAEVLGLV